MLVITPALIKQKFGSLDSLSRHLVSEFPELQWPEPRSVSPKITMLCNGNVVWWKSRPAHAEALASALSLDVADLGLHAHDAPGWFHFADFPELPSLDPANDRFCQLASATRLGDRGGDDLELWFGDTPRQLQRQPTSHTWLQVAPGTGRKVLLAEFAARGRFEVVEADRLADAALTLRKRVPIVASIAEAGGDDDILALARRPDGAATLVLAPFPAPVHSARDSLSLYSWENATASPLDRRALELTRSGGWIDSIQPAEWRLASDWRVRLLQWVEARLDRHGVDTLFSAAGLQRWLLDFDPQGEWIRTPADIMALCRVSHRLPYTRLPKALDQDASRKLIKVLTAPKRDEDALFIRLARARWDAMEQPWRAPLPGAQWQAWCPPMAGIDVTEDLLAIANGAKREDRRQHAQRLAGRLAGLGSLEAAGFLAKDAHGNLDLRPRLLADIVTRDYLMEAVKRGAIALWAPACFDRERRLTVDAALDALTLDELALAWGLLERDVDPPLADGLALAASEALFCAAGRRILRGDTLPVALASLAIRMATLLPLDESGWSLPAAWTRPCDSLAERCDWIAYCWAWSLQPRPVLDGLAQRVGWLFPGWAGDDPAAPFWINLLVSDINEADDAFADDLSWQRLMSAAEQLLARRERPFDEAPAPVHHALLAGAAQGRWPADAEWWRFVIRHAHAEARLLQALGPLDAAMAARLWRSWIGYELRYANEPEAFRSRWSPVRQRILSALDPADLLGSVDDTAVRYLVAMVGTLPPGLRRALIERLPLTALPDEEKIQQRFFGYCEPDAAHLLTRWLPTEHTWYAAERMWELDAGAALQWIRAHAAVLPEKAAFMVRLSRQCDAAPVARLLLEVRGLLDDEERVAWARSRLPRAGVDAGLVLSVAEAAGAGISACLRQSAPANRARAG